MIKKLLPIKGGAFLPAGGFRDSVPKNPASFFEKKLDQKTLIQAFLRESIEV